MTTTLDNYYDLRDESDDQFEQYQITENAILQILYFDQDDISRDSTGIELVKEKVDPDDPKSEEEYGWPLNLSDAELKQWVNTVAEFQI